MVNALPPERAANSALRARAQVEECRRLLEKGQPAVALRAADEAVRSYRRLAADRPTRYEMGLSEALGAHAAALVALGRYREAEAVTREAIEVFRRHFEPILLTQEHSGYGPPAPQPPRESPPPPTDEATHVDALFWEGVRETALRSDLSTWFERELVSVLPRLYVLMTVVPGPFSLARHFVEVLRYKRQLPFELVERFEVEERAVIGEPSVSSDDRAQETAIGSPEAQHDNTLPLRWEPVAYFLQVRLPCRVRPGGQVFLTVRIRGDAPSPTGGKSSGNIDLEANGPLITIVVTTAPGLVPLCHLLHDLRVSNTGGSEAARFGFKAAAGHDSVPVRVLAIAGGTVVAELSHEVLIGDGPAKEITIEAPITSLFGWAGEVTLEIRPGEPFYTFTLFSPTNERRAGPEPSPGFTTSPGGTADKTIQHINQTVKGIQGPTDEAAYWDLRSEGVRLWGLVPDKIRQEYWRLRDTMAIEVFTIDAENDVIPWELLCPVRESDPGQQAADPAENDFLIAQYQVIRRVCGERPRYITIEGDNRYVIAPGSSGTGRGVAPPAEAEIEAIRKILAGAAPTSEVVHKRKGLLDAINSGRMGLLHFACHNLFRPDTGGSVIWLEDAPFRPISLSHAVLQKPLAKLHPLVFMNACETERGDPQYTDLLGWPGQFLGAGAGAFIGTHWAVRSDSARVFAETFYSVLAAGHTLGKAVHIARRKLRDQNPADPTWLAYTVYGNPWALATPKEKS